PARPGGAPLSGRPPKRAETTVFHYGLRAATGLFGRLENQHGRAVKIAGLRQIARRADQNGSVAVMSAAMHQTGFARLVYKVVVFSHGQRVHVRAQAYHAAAVAPTAPNHAHHTGFTDAAVHFDAQRLKRPSHNAGGAHLFETEFGMRMQVAA